MELVNQNIEKLRALFKQGFKRAVILPHISPDGDAVGSCSALAQILDKEGIKSDIVMCDTIADYLKFLPKAKEFVSLKLERERVLRIINNADVMFMMDHNSHDRVGDLQPYCEHFNGIKVMIDHHIGPSPVDIVISDAGSPATCLLLYKVVTSLFGKDIVDSNIANALYTGISTDTGNFNHAASDPELYRIVADLLERGLERDYVYSMIYQTATENKLRLMGNVILNDMQLVPHYPIALLPIRLEELEKFSYKDGDLEGVVNMPLSMDGIAISVMITERKDRVKLSIRSKGDIAVNTWCESCFNGGGHKNASGGKMDIPFDEVYRLVCDSIPDFFEHLKK